MTETRTVTIKGREIEVTRISETQILLIGRAMGKADRVVRDVARNGSGDGQAKAVFTGIAQVLDILESRVVDQDDKEYLIDLMVAGDLEVDELLPIMSVWSEDEAAGPAKPSVTRGRPAKRR